MAVLGGFEGFNGVTEMLQSVPADFRNVPGISMYFNKCSNFIERIKCTFQGCFRDLNGISRTF